MHWDYASRWALTGGLILVCLVLSGCAAFTNPVAQGIPVSDVPLELLAQHKSNLVPIPLACLRQRPPKTYLLGPRDILGVYIEGVLGQTDQNPPVSLADSTNFMNLPPAIGFPIPVRDDGTIPLPMVDHVSVQGMTVTQAEQAIIDAYTVKKKLLDPGRARFIVTLMRPRTTRVLVVRQDSPGSGGGNTGIGLSYSRGMLGGGQSTSNARHQTAMAVDLPAYGNDVLSALTMTGGLPGFDAKPEVIIQKNGLPTSEAASPKPGDLSSETVPSLSQDGGPVHTVRIPLRLPRGQSPNFRPEDILLQEGDVVCIESRDAEVFYTGGFLPAGEHVLPRDYDLDVVKAIMAVDCRHASGSGGNVPREAFPRRLVFPLERHCPAHAGAPRTDG